MNYFLSGLAVTFAVLTGCSSSPSLGSSPPGDPATGPFIGSANSCPSSPPVVPESAVILEVTRSYGPSDGGCTTGALPLLTAVHYTVTFSSKTIHVDTGVTRPCGDGGASADAGAPSDAGWTGFAASDAVLTEDQIVALYDLLTALKLEALTQETADWGSGAVSLRDASGDSETFPAAYSAGELGSCVIEETGYDALLASLESALTPPR
jgi:hypothetical protein